MATAFRYHCCCHPHPRRGRITSNGYPEADLKKLPPPQHSHIPTFLNDAEEWSRHKGLSPSLHPRNPWTLKKVWAQAVKLNRELAPISRSQTSFKRLKNQEFLGFNQEILCLKLRFSLERHCKLVWWNLRAFFRCKGAGGNAPVLHLIGSMKHLTYLSAKVTKRSWNTQTQTSYWKVKQQTQTYSTIPRIAQRWRNRVKLWQPHICATAIGPAPQAAVHHLLWPKVGRSGRGEGGDMGRMAQ